VAVSRLAEEPAPTVLDLTSPVLSSELAELEDRLHVVNGLLDALGRVNEVHKVVQFSPARPQALIALQEEPFSYTKRQAEAVLDMPMSWQASEGAERLRSERDHLMSRRAGLREHVTEVLSLHWFG